MNFTYKQKCLHSTIQQFTATIKKILKSKSIKSCYISLCRYMSLNLIHCMVHFLDCHFFTCRSISIFSLGNLTSKDFPRCLSCLRPGVWNIEIYYRPIKCIIFQFNSFRAIKLSHVTMESKIYSPISV